MLRVKGRWERTAGHPEATAHGPLFQTGSPVASSENYLCVVVPMINKNPRAREEDQEERKTILLGF